MANGLWFGTRAYMQYVPQPAFNADYSKAGWDAGSQFLNGGASVRRSAGAHKVYNMAWNLASRDTLRPITDYAEGVYGDGLIYFLDAMTMDKNVLPQGWAFPAQPGAPSLLSKAKPTIVDTEVNSQGYPSKSAVYTLSATSVSKSIYIPIPPGYTAWVGVHGTSVAAATDPNTGAPINAPSVLVTPNTGTGGPVALLPVDTPNRVNTTVAGSGFELSLTGAGTLTIAGIIVQVLPIGATPSGGGVISGQGHSGCAFASQPSQTAYSAALDKVGMTATLVEVGIWK